MVPESGNGHCCHFSSLLSNSDKQKLVDNIISRREPHLIKDLPSNVAELHVSRIFFETTGCDDSFLSAYAVISTSAIYSHQTAMRK